MTSKEGWRYSRTASLFLFVRRPLRALARGHQEREVDFPELIKMMVDHDLKREARRANIEL